jgi:hypothetical protein
VLPSSIVGVRVTPNPASVEVANYNFNTLGFALVRKEAQKKASGAL